MRRRLGKITVTGMAEPAHGTVLAIGTGDDMELVRVRWSLRRRFAVWLRWTAGPWLRWRLCAAAGHRVVVDAVTGLGHCWCRRRWEDGADWDEDEGGYE